MLQPQKNTVDSAIALAKKAVKQEKAGEAVKLYSAVLRHFPNHAAAKKGLSKLQQKKSSKPKGMKGAQPHQKKINALVKLYNSGKLTKAERESRKMLKTYPETLIALNILAASLNGQGRRKEELQTIEKIIELKPDDAQAYNNRGIILYELKDYERAIDSFDKAIGFNSGFAQAYNNRGSVLKDLGRLEEAAKGFERAVELNPDYAEAYNNFGNILTDLGRIQEAVDSYDKAIAVKPDFAQAYHARGGVLKDIGRLDKALSSFENAVRFRNNDAKAYHQLSLLKKFEPEDALVQVMAGLLADPQSSEPDRMHLCFALAKAYDDLNDYEKSIEFLNRGNKLQKQQTNYSLDSTKEFFDRVREIFGKNNIQGISFDDFDPIGLVFIVGMPRSGTTLVEQILASHSKVHGAGELEYMNRLAAAIVLRQSGPDHQHQSFQACKNEIRQLRDEYLSAIRSLKVSGTMVTDKLPLNFIWIGFILSAFPGAKIIHVNRDPKATCWSIYKHYFETIGNAYANDMEDLAGFYKLYLNLMAYWQNQFGDKIYNLCYEQLTENQENETRRLLEYCGLEFEGQCLDFHKTKRVVKTLSAAQVRKKMYKGSSSAWKKYEKHIQPMLASLEEI